jgi:hypothetical protein
VLTKVQVIWVVTAFRLAASCRRFGGAFATQLLYPAIQEERKVAFLWTDSRQKRGSEWLKLAAM